MQGADPGIITHLNTVLKTNLTGINQYFLHARMLKHMGNVKLADHEYKASIDIMKHSDMLVEHILSLGGFPNLQDLGGLMIGKTIEEMLKNDLAFSQAALSQVKEAIAYSEKNSGVSSIGVLRRILESQLEHIDFTQKQLISLPVQASAVKITEKEFA